MRKQCRYPTGALSIFLGGMILFILSCHHDTGTIKYSELKYDTATMIIFEWDTSKGLFPNNSDPLRLTQDSLSIIDSLLNGAIAEFNNTIAPGLYSAFNKQVPLDTFVIKRSNYKWQFRPYRDVNGESVIDVNGFCNDFPRWKVEYYIGRPHGVVCKVNFRMNLTKRRSERLYTGDFG